MSVIDRRGKPLPPTHPFATPRVVFGQGRPHPMAEAPSLEPDAPTLANVGFGKPTNGEAAKKEQSDE
jgi:hypothetical protein